MSTDRDGSGLLQCSALFYDFTPKRLQARPQFATCRPARAAARTYDYVHGRQLVLIEPERFTDGAADSIAFDAAACHFHRHGQPETRDAMIV